MAKEIESKYGIPYEAVAAVAVLESKSGTSELATTCNNYFGIKCFQRHDHSKCLRLNNDKPNEPFRYFTTVDSCFSYFGKLTTTGRYKHKPHLQANAFIEMIKSKGYATDPKYVAKLKYVAKRIKTGTWVFPDQETTD